MTLALIVTCIVTTAAYSRWLKHIALVDAITVAAGFVCRTAAGGTATGITITPIFLTVSATAALFTRWAISTLVRLGLARICRSSRSRSLPHAVGD